MTSKANQDGTKSVPVSREIESQYLKLVKFFYGRDDFEQSRKIASSLEELLAASPQYSDSIRAEEIRSMIAELRGDLVGATRSREAEIRKILELHALTANTPAWRSVARRYGFSDVSDRLDLLAILYDAQGERDRAILVLLESKHYCESHGIPFDAQDVLHELGNGRSGAAHRKRARPVSRQSLSRLSRATRDLSRPAAPAGGGGPRRAGRR